MPLVCSAEAQVWPRPILAALRQWQGWVCTYRLGPCGPNDATNPSDVHHLTSPRFLYPWFVRMRPSCGPDADPDPPWPHLAARMGLGL